MNHNIQTISEQLVQAVNLIMCPYTPTAQRNEAHKRIEEFKETSPSCAECGFFLSLPSNASPVRHFGLRLVDHYIKLHWNSISCDEKISIKNNVLQILSKDVSFQEDSHVKDALARIVVEIIKREWPQQWPSLLDELHTLCIIGDVQTELVLLIFLRLAEDIVQFQNVPDKRRREVYKSLCGHLAELLKFFLSTLCDQCEKHFAHKSAPVQQPNALQNHCRVAHVALQTLSVFVEWIPINHIAEESNLFKQLCNLLDNETLQIDAAQCLLSLVERKGKHEDKKHLLNLFEERELFKPRSQNTQTLEQYNLFLKILAQTLVTLGTNLSFLMGMFKDVKEPENFSLYLNCVLSLTKHPSVVVSQYTQALWSTLLRDNKLSQSSSVQSIIPNLLKCETEKLFKIGLPSKPGSNASQFSLIEFDCDEDFENVYHKLRSDACEILKLISKQHTEMAFNCGSMMLKSLLCNQPLQFILEMGDSCCLDALLIWDGVVHYIDAVCCPLMKNITLPGVENISKEGVELLQLTLNFDPEDLYVRSYVLSCTSALFFFANFYMDALVPVITKIFSYLMYQPISEGKHSLPKDLLNLRRHASSLLIKLCTNQPKLLLPVFDDLCRSVKDLVDKPEHLSPLEKSALLEALMILSNELCDYNKQLMFLNELVSPVIGMWLTDDMKTMLSSPEHFIAFIGLNQSPDESNDAFQKNKSQLLLLCNVIKTCAKRCRMVTNSDIAEKGNFIHPLSQNLNSVLYRNPSAQLLCPAFPAVFYLIRTIHSLYDPDVQAKIHPGFADATNISEVDKNCILGISNVETNNQPKTACERMKNYIQGIHDSCLLTLGDATESIMIDFYMIPNLSGYLNDCLFHCLQYLPDFKLRPIIRTFLKPFFYRCPVNLCGDLVNTLAGFCNFMFQKLTTVWQKFQQRYGTCIGYEEQMTELQEVYEDLLNRLLTREYIAFLGALLQNKPVLDASENQMDDDSKMNSSNSNRGQSKQLSELGLKIFQTEAVRGAITCTAFDGLHWLDTVTNINCLNVSELVFKQLLKDNLIQQIHEANYLLQNALHGLQELGEHDSNQGLLLSFAILVYENLRPKFPDLRDALVSSVGCDLQAVEKMEKVMFREGNQKTGIDKQKREAFKQVVQKIIGKNIGQYHKRDIVIKNLPPLFIVPKKETDIVSRSDFDGLCNLFVPSC